MLVRGSGAEQGAALGSRVRSCPALEQRFVLLPCRCWCRRVGGISRASLGARGDLLPTPSLPAVTPHRPPSASLPLPLLQLQTQMWLPASPRGLLSSLVTLHVLRLGSADFNVVGPGHPLHVAVGQDIVLPCHLSPSMEARSLDIRWIRHQVSDTVHHYRNGEDLYSDQVEEYVGRTELVRDGLSSGRLDLRISALRPSDDGQYVCTVRNGSSSGEATVKLEVAATGSVPQLSLEAYEDGGIRVVCRSAGWYPLPEVLWKDPDGQHLPSVSQRHSSDQRGLFDIEGIIIVTNGNRDGNWSCVVRNSRLNQEQETSLHISAPFFHNARPWMVGVAVLLVLSVVLLVVGAYLWRRKGLQSRELEKRDAALDVVTLDPNSAHPELVLSADGRSVRWGRARQDLPDTPERFMYQRCVLGQEGFREGRHCWEVEVKGEVGGDSWWAVGVARDSVNRKGNSDLSPEGGVWGIWHCERLFVSLTFPPIFLSPIPIPRRLWVCLDCTQGLVTFINAKNGVEIFTFPLASFKGEIIRPWFWVDTWNIELCLRDSTF
ncbi:butyrophilin subfamily 3 member A2-like isoform X2 [Balearica regulorum gibbericeps]|uniref:butyrophilin subfamily 3 member A2-like isoform X2 n=1 Tax=Balearica regulorum gibbericeps TaxID=100784 RepID=UPI003F6490EA